MSMRPVNVRFFSVNAIADASVSTVSATSASLSERRNGTACTRSGTPE
jgi:hypothetical protein